MATAQTDEGPMLIFDLENKKYLYSVSNKVYDDYFASAMLVNDQKTHVLFSTDKAVPGVPKSDDITQAVVWDVVNSRYRFISVFHPLDKNIRFYKCLRFFYSGLLSQPRRWKLS